MGLRGTWGLSPSDESLLFGPNGPHCAHVDETLSSVLFYLLVTLSRLTTPTPPNRDDDRVYNCSRDERSLLGAIMNPRAFILPYP